MAETINYRFVMRRALAATWVSLNDVLLEGEYGFEKDTGKVKVGDGVTGWNDLDYFNSGGAPGVSVQTGTSYTLTADDAEKTVMCYNPAPFSLSIPADSEENLPIGFRAAYVQGGDGTVTVTGNAGVTVHAPNGNTTGAPYDGGVAEKIGANEWQLWNSPQLATVARTGNYNDLTGKPTYLGGISEINEQTANYELVAADSVKAIRVTVAGGAATVTVPSGVGLPLLCTIPVLQGDGAVTIVPGAGVTLESPNGAATNGVGDFRVLFQRATDIWVVA